MSKADLRLEIPDDGRPPRLHLQVRDSDLLGHDAHLQLRLHGEVKDSRPVHDNRVLFEHRFRLEQTEASFDLPAHCLRQIYTFQGKQLHIRLMSRLLVDDSVLFDSAVDHDHPLPFHAKPQKADDPKLMDPTDVFHFIANLSVLPARNKLIVLVLLIAGGFVVLGNLLLGVHDEFVPESQAYFYDHRGEDGSESPIMKALTGSGVTGVALWAAIMFQLRKYMRFELKKHPPIRPDSRLRLNDLVEGESRVALRDITLRVVACNRECGAYKRGSGTSERTVTFKTPVQAVKLYERRFVMIPANMPIGPYLNDEVDFGPMFRTLLPPLAIGSNHGIDLRWEVQLLHPQFVDHELEGDVSGMTYSDFEDGRD